MSYQHVPFGSPLVLTLSLHDQHTGRFVRARVRDKLTGSEVSGSPFTLSHISEGYYRNNSFTPASAVGEYEATYSVYADAGFTSFLKTYGQSTDTFDVDNSVSETTSTKSVVDTNLDTTISSRESEASASSRASTNQAEHDATQAAIGTPVGTVSSDIASIKSDSSAIKIKTDQLNFSGSDVLARAEVVDDKTGYALTTADKDSIVDKVWDELLSGHTLSGSAGKALSDASGGVAATAIANAVWDALIAGHVAAGSFGELMQVILQFVTDNNTELLSAHGLQAILDEVVSRANTIVGEVNANEVKIDTIIPAIVAARNAVIAEVDQNQLLIEGVATQLTSTQLALTAEIDQNEVKIDTLQSSVGALQNNTTVRFIVPERLIKPELGSKTYQFHLRLFDSDGHAEAPDSTPTIRVRDLAGGVDLVSGAAMTQDGIKVGAYYYNYAISAGTDKHQLLVEATIVEGGQTRYVPAVTEVSEFEADLDAIQTQISAMDTKVTDTQTKVNNPIFGLSALKTGQTAIVGEIDVNESKIDQVKAKTDLIPSSPATSAEVAAVTTAVLTRPDIATIITQLNILRDSIRGAGGRTNTDVYDKIDFTAIAKTSDPRFAHLDADISSRSTLTAANVWTYVTRTLTAFTLPAAEAAKVWDYLTSAATTPNSLGKRVADFLDASVSSRATASQVSGLLSGVAQESTLSAVLGSLTNEANENEIKLNTVISLLNLIQPKTANLPASPASETNVTAQAVSISNLISNLNLLTTAIKSKTDNLPVNPAKESSVLARPTNPVLSTDPRIAHLDADISSRSSLSAASLVPLAKTSDVTAAKSDIVNEVNQNETKIDSAIAAISLRPTSSQMDTKLIPVAKTSDVTAAKNEILDAVDDIPVGGGGTTPADVWAYSARTLTASPTDTSALAKTSDLAVLSKVQYVNRISTTLVTSTGNQQLLVWAEKDGQRISGTNCTVTIKDSAGVVKWTSSLVSPNSDGVFKFTNTISVIADENYYVVITITVDGQPRTNQQAFFTVG